VILGNGEDNVAIAVVLDLGERALVSGEKNRPHGCIWCVEVGVGGLYVAGNRPCLEILVTLLISLFQHCEVGCLIRLTVCGD
jgi:hypothetical protein